MKTSRDGPAADRGALIALGVLILLAAGTALRPIAAYDTMWHLEHGRLALHFGAYTYPDPTSFTLPGKSFTNQNWIIDALMYSAWRLGRWPALQWLTAFAVAAAALTAGLVARRVAEDRPWLAVTAVALTMGVAIYRFHPRPYIFSYAAVGLALLVAERYAHAEGRATWYWGVGLLLFGIVWSHAHASFVLLPPIVGIAVIGGARTRGPKAQLGKLVLVLLMAALPLASPFGADFYRFATSVSTGAVTSDISEMRPLKLAWLIPTSFGSFLWLDVLLLIGAFRSIKGLRFRLDDLLRVAMGLILTLIHNRFRVVWALLMIPWVVRKYRYEGPHKADRAIALLSLAVIPLALQTTGHNTGGKRLGFGLTEAWFPEDASRFIKRAPLEGNVFNYYSDGGWLSLQHARKLRIAIDGRTPTFFDAELYDLYRQAHYTPEAWQAFAARYGAADLALIERVTPLCPTLRDRFGWVPLFVDQQRTLLARTTTVARAAPRLQALDACDPHGAVVGACKGRHPAAAQMRAELAAQIELVPEAAYPRYLAAEWEVSCQAGRPARAVALLAPVVSGSDTAALHFVYVRALLGAGMLNEAEDAISLLEAVLDAPHPPLRSALEDARRNADPPDATPR